VKTSCSATLLCSEASHLPITHSLVVAPCPTVGVWCVFLRDKLSDAQKNKQRHKCELAHIYAFAYFFICRVQHDKAD